MQGTIHHIEIYVSDLKKSTLFWSWLLAEKFGYKIFQQWDEGISFKLNDSYIVFVQTASAYLSRGYNRKHTGLNHIAFHCNSEIFVDELTAELREKSIPVLYPEKHPFAGGAETYAVYFEDPDRIKVEVVKSKWVK